MPSTSKKEIILAYRRAHGVERAGPVEIRMIQTELRRKMGGRGASSSYIASVLRESGTRVDYENGFVDTPLEEPYAARLEGVVAFSDFEAAECSIFKLDALHREFLAAHDRTGARLVRSLGLKAKRRAESLAASPRVNVAKRREKKEIANWFRVWLESPDVFAGWIDLRKRSEEFRGLFLKI